MARAKHLWRREADKTNAFINKVERQRKQQEMVEGHRNIKKSGLRITSTAEETISEGE